MTLTAISVGVFPAMGSQIGADMRENSFYFSHISFNKSSKVFILHLRATSDLLRRLYRCSNAGWFRTSRRLFPFSSLQPMG
jgi:hypothetical protein